MTVPNGPQRNRSAYRFRPFSSGSLIVRKRWDFKTSRTKSVATSGSAASRTLALKGAWVKNVSFIRVRGWKASFHSRGARLTEQARTLVVRSTMIDLNNIEEKTAKSPSLSKTGVQPPYLECIAAIQLACVAASEAIPAGTCTNRVPASDSSPRRSEEHTS